MGAQLSARGRYALFAVAVGALVAVAILLLSSKASEPEGERRATASRAPEAREFDEVEEEAARILRAESAHAKEDAGHSPAQAVIEASRGPEAAAARAVAEAYFAAFSRYEVGELSVAVARGLRASASRRFAEELLASPARVPAGVRRPRPARLLSLELVMAPDRRSATANVRARGPFGVYRATYLMRPVAEGWRVVGEG
jgi:hypothetical protein